MRCPGCDYPLWNLAARVCPECGRPFRPSDFEFVPNSVRFCCPHCKQDYYGTGPSGHLVPREFDCVRCGHHIDEDQMVLLPTAGVAEEQTQVDQMPWLIRGKIGFFRAWWGTLWRVLFNPARLARSTPADSGVAQGWLFMLVTLGGAMLIGVLPMGVFMYLVSGGRAPMWSMMFGLGGIALPALLLSLIAVPLWGLLAHLLLCITGRPALGPGATVRTMCYASGACLLPALPCVGPFFGWFAGWLWPVISAAVMLCRVQRVGPFRAAIAAISAPLLLWAGVAAFILTVIVPGVSTASSSVARAQRTMAQSNLLHIFAALQTYANANDGKYPAHPIDLIADNSILAGELSPSFARTAPATQRPASILDRWQVLSQHDQAALKSRFDEAPAGPGSPQRLGDTIFFTRGLAPGARTWDAWIVLYIPPPGATDFSGDPIPIQALTADGRIKTYTPAEFPAALTLQNTTRAPLPAIPDPATITERGAPAGSK